MVAVGVVLLVLVVECSFELAGLEPCCVVDDDFCVFVLPVVDVWL